MRVQLVYDIDSREEWRELSPGMYTTEPGSKIWSWTLLTTVPLSNVTPGEVIGNPGSGTRGRPRLNRFTPLYGPTSGNNRVPRTSAANEAVGSAGGKRGAGGKRRKR